MSYAADMGATSKQTPEETQRLERMAVQRIAKQLDLSPLDDHTIPALSLGVVYDDEGNAYALADILSALADRSGVIDSDFRDPHADGVFVSETTLAEAEGLIRQFAARQPEDSVDSDPANHYVPFQYLLTVAIEHYGRKPGYELPPVLATMHNKLYSMRWHELVQHSDTLRGEIGGFHEADKPAPGIFTERLHKVNEHLQQLDAERDDG